MKDQKQTKRQSPIEYVVSLWWFHNIVCQVKIVRSTKTQKQYDEASGARSRGMLLSDMHRCSEGQVEEPCVGWELRLQGQHQDQGESEWQDWCTTCQLESRT